MIELPSPDSAPKTVPSRRPRTPVSRFSRPLIRFLHIESIGGLFLLVCTTVALVLANSHWADAFSAFWHTPIVLQIGSFVIQDDLQHLLINDGLMTIFFFVVGLEIKREMVAGELRDIRKAALPILGALGGMIAPALLYLLVLGSAEGKSGWGIPMATDIAFVVGFLALIGPRVPLGLKIFLLTLAIADDIGGVLVIAIFYSKDLALVPLGLAGACFLLIILLHRLGVRQVPVYVFVGMVIWLATWRSGVHPTVAGVALGLMTPSKPWIGEKALLELLSDTVAWMQGKYSQHEEDKRAIFGEVQITARESISPLQRLERLLHSWVAFVIMPIFALANAGVPLAMSGFQEPVALAVAVGLVVGKPLGIVLFSSLGIALGLARYPSGMNFKVLIGAGALAGIGFTVAMFIASLALEGTVLAAAKLGILCASVVSAILGSTLLILWLPKTRTPEQTAASPA